MNSEQTQQRCQNLIRQMHLPDSFITVVSDVYLPLSEIIMQKVKAQPLFISINGAQGTGKSTLSLFLKHIIESEHQCRVANLSLDDFYTVREKRLALAETVHPLLATRGVPGTHDLDLLEQVLDRLLKRQPCTIPRFNKAMDDRELESGWTNCDEPVDVILFEGWCNSSPPQTEKELELPINELEEKEDSQGIWRSYANEHLVTYQERIFDYADVCIMLKAPDFECIYEWRSLQEKKLASSNSLASENHIMNDVELRRFIQHYERISRHTLKTLPLQADIVLPMRVDHSIEGIRITGAEPGVQPGLQSGGHRNEY